MGTLCLGGASVVVYAVDAATRWRLGSEVRNTAWVVSLLLLVAPTLIAIVVAWRAHLRLEARCAAIAPAAPGEPAECRVCGAPLPASPGRLVVRCTYCRADNVVSSAAMSKLVEHLHRAASSLDEHIRRETRAARSPTRWILLSLLPLGFGAPAISLTVVWLLVDHAKSIPAEYVSLTTQKGQCFFRVHHSMLGAEYFGKDGARIWREMTPARPGVERFLASALVGREVYGEGGSVGKVERAKPSPYPDMGFYLDVRHGDRVVPIAATETCLVRSPGPKLLALLVDDDSAVDAAVMILATSHVIVGLGRSLVVAPKHGGAWVRLQLSGGSVQGLALQGPDLWVESRSHRTKIPGWLDVVSRAQPGTTVPAPTTSIESVASGERRSFVEARERASWSARLPPIPMHDSLQGVAADENAAYWVVRTPRNSIGFPPSALLIMRRED